MSEYVVYHMPGACSRVVLNALEEAGVAYRDVSVALGRGEQHAPGYLAINPKGKVPVLVADRVVMTELPVILHYLGHAHPAAKLLPAGADVYPTLASLSDTVWLAGTLHPAAARVFRPQVTSQSDAAQVKEAAIKLLAGHAERISARLAESVWWYGETWSITDMLIAWVFGLAAQFGFPLQSYAALADHRLRVEARPSYARALARERAAIQRDQLPTPPGLSV